MKKLSKFLALMMAVVLLTGSCLTVSAAENYPSYDGEGYYLVLSATNGVPMLYCTASPLYVLHVNGEIRLYCRDFCTLNIYYVDSTSGTWKYSSSNTQSSGTALGVVNGTVFESNYDILYDDGSLFFQGPTETTLTTESNTNVIVTANIPGLFSVTVPKSLSLSEDGIISEECVSVSADLAGGKQIELTVPNTVTLSSEGKADITGVVALSKTAFTSTELAGGAVVKSVLSIDASENISAGEWNGSFDLTVGVNDIP